MNRSKKNIDALVVSQVDWTSCASTEELELARNGKLILNFYDKEVPEDWIKDIRKKGPLFGGSRGIASTTFSMCRSKSYGY